MGGYAEFYLTRSEYLFAGIEASKGRIAILGVPFDGTASYRPGQRFGPAALRRASVNLESNSLVTGDEYVEGIPVADLGDLAVVHGDAHETLARTSRVVSELASEGVMPAVIGGEHLITLGVLEGLHAIYGRLCLVSFDAHYDLRDDYLGLQLSHATYARRAWEKGLLDRIVYVGVRAWDKEESVFAEEKPVIHMVHAREVYRLGSRTVAGVVRRHLEPCKHVYITVDMDVYDPAFAPGVANPEPGGLNPYQVMEVIHDIVDERIVGFDVVELSPDYDCSGATSLLAAKTMQELAIATGRTLKRKG